MTRAQKKLSSEAKENSGCRPSVAQSGARMSLHTTPRTRRVAPAMRLDRRPRRPAPARVTGTGRLLAGVAASCASGGGGVGDLLQNAPPTALAPFDEAGAGRGRLAAVCHYSLPFHVLFY